MKRNYIITVFLLVLMVFVSCSTIDSDVKKEEEIKVVETVVKEPQAAAVTKETYEWKYTLNGYTSELSADSEKAVITYPSVLTETEVRAFFDSVSSDYEKLQKAVLQFPGEGTAVLTGLDLKEIQDFTAFLDFKASDYIRSLTDPSYSPVTSLSVSDDLRVLYTLNTEAGQIVCSLMPDSVTVSFPEGFDQQESKILKAVVSENLGLSFDENNSAVLSQSLSFKEILALLSSMDGAATEYALSYTVPEAVSEAVSEVVSEPVSVAESVSKAIETAQQIASEGRAEEVSGLWFLANPPAVILGVVGLCVLLGVLYYFIVYKPKTKKK